MIPTYERREHVRRAVESVLAQTLSDFEIIVVDDGSTDGTEDALAGLDVRLRCHRQPNRGVSSARNAGIRLARAGVVAFLDSDNRWLPNHLSLLTEMLSSHPEAVAASTCPHFRLKGREPVGMARVVDLLPTLTFGTTVGFISCVAVRRNALLAVGCFNEELPVWEDSDLFLRLAMLGPFCVLGHRTLIHQKTADGARARGIRAGRYFDAMELSADSAEPTLLGLDRPDAHRLLDSLRANRFLVRGMRAAVERDHEAAASMLQQACRLHPDLSRRPGIVLSVLRHGLADGRSLQDALEATALAWPDADSDTARFLAMCAGALALRTGRLRDAASWFVRSNVLLRPSLLIRTRRQIERLARESLTALGVAAAARIPVGDVDARG